MARLFRLGWSRRASLEALRAQRQTRALLVHDALTRLQREPRYQSSGSLIPYGRKMYSQNEEDGLIQEIFRRIGTTSRTFLKIGIWDGLGNNTLALLFQGWRGAWIEASRTSVGKIRAGLLKTIRSGALTVVNSFVTRENVNRLIESAIGRGEVDLLSVDIDGNDYHVFDAIGVLSARVVVIEYNAKFPPPIVYCIDYEAGHVWRGDDHFGASLQFLEERFLRKGYKLVACNLTGSNAFFVRGDLVGDRFLPPFSAEMHYVPARYHLVGFESGHPPAFATLERSFDCRKPSEGSSRPSLAPAGAKHE